jgi:hypothetical protein
MDIYPDKLDFFPELNGIASPSAISSPLFSHPIHHILKLSKLALNPVY